MWISFNTFSEVHQCWFLELVTMNFKPYPRPCSKGSIKVIAADWSCTRNASSTCVWFYGNIRRWSFGKYGFTFLYTVSKTHCCEYHHQSFQKSLSALKSCRAHKREYTFCRIPVVSLDCIIGNKYTFYCLEVTGSLLFLREWQLCYQIKTLFYEKMGLFSSQRSH